MNYKHIIRSRRLRIKLLGYLSFIPDMMMIKLQYRIKTGRKLILHNPQRYTEKLQWYKLFYRDPLMARCSNKLTVREYVAEQGYSNTLNELYGVYNTPEEICFSELPNQFVIKATIGGGGNSIFICKDKSKLDLTLTIETIREWVSQSARKSSGREWVYDKQNNQLIIEKYLDSKSEKGGLIDYKFFCFQGKVKYIYVIADREIGEKAGVGIFDISFNQLPYFRVDENPLKRKVEKPVNFELMISYAETLSKDFPHVRVDIYDQNGEIIFGELTFFDGSGYMKFEPDEFDYELGRHFVLPEPRSLTSN